MFDSGDSTQTPEVEASDLLSRVPESQWSQVLREQHAVIARAQSLEVDAIATLYLTRCAEDERRGCNDAFQGEFASAEIGFVYRVSEPVAQRVIGLSLDLRWRLHATATEFAAGRIDQQRAQAISDALSNVSEDKVALVEALLLDKSEQLNLPTLRAKARRLIARHDPDGAKARREAAEADRDVRFRANEDGTCTLDGTLPGPGGQVVAMRLRRMCFEVCCHDPRTFAQRRADALVALAAGAGFLACVCGHGDCAATVPERAVPEGAVPERAAPEGVVPEGAVPSGTVQDSALPEGTVSEGAVLEGAVQERITAEPEPETEPRRGRSGDTAGTGDAATAHSIVTGDDSVHTPAKSPGTSEVDHDADATSNNAHTRRADPRADTAPAALTPLPTATVHVGVNLTTLLGLDDLPGYLAGHGWIDADLARQIAADGTWRKVLTLTDADRDAILDALCGHTGTGEAGQSCDPPPDREERGSADHRAAADHTCPGTPHSTHAPASTHAPSSTHAPASAPTRTSGIPVPEQDSQTMWLSGRRLDTLPHGAILGIGRALKAAGITPTAIRDRSRTRREQLTYRPSARLAEIVRTRDGGCRFPGCTARAAICDLDHTVPFDHAHPERGGLTVEQNLACLCRRHHRLKTRGLWTVRQLGGGRLEWTTPTGELVVTEPAGAFTGSADGRLADEALAAAHGLTLTGDATLANLFTPYRGRDVEADLSNLLDIHSLTAPLAWIADPSAVTILDGSDPAGWSEFLDPAAAAGDPAPY